MRLYRTSRVFAQPNLSGDSYYLAVRTLPNLTRQQRLVPLSTLVPFLRIAYRTHLVPYAA